MSRRAGRRPPPPARRGRSPSTLVLAIGGLVIAVAAIAAIAVTQFGSGQSSAPSAASSPIATASQASGLALPAFAEGADDPAVGRRIPDVTGVSFDGTPVSIKADGRPKLILFIAHWCSHCQVEVPVVQAWIDAKGMPAGVDLVSVATAIDPTLPNYPPDAWLAREHWSVPVLVDSSRQVALDYGLTAFPYWVAVGADGNVVVRLTGELTAEQLDTLVTAVTSP